eukprot:CAMPEP_0185030452 /NCGR_PEP_ID=MMETSP1103-20130426/17436_1 /TAXON_ID=36769 /ORGANISM="Paraphysomonas bandaiensis, Strain Caron Lab Isolate" /LENGTH=678 /DNA_ID=CAMNT_0027565603 /DNA_START=60 /DNA_END=2093 /DNA_ORIENTATION=-
MNRRVVLVSLVVLICLSVRFSIYGINSLVPWKSNRPLDIHYVMNAWEKKEYEMQHRVTGVLSSSRLRQCNDDAYVTFVMPTYGSRPSISTSMQSIINLDECGWRLIVVYAVVDDAAASELHQEAPFQLTTIPQYIWQDPRIYFLPYKSTVARNYGGSQRNAAFRHISTPWIAFLDDDDTITADYITLLKKEIRSYPEAAAVLFRMTCTTCEHTVIPPESYRTIEANHAGISFAVRRVVVTPLGNHKFVDGPAEDYKFLHDMVRGGLEVVLSGSVAYLVKGNYIKPEIPMASTIVHLIDNNETEFQQPILRPILGFDFPEKDSIFFGSNIRGLQQSLERLRGVGCIDSVFFDAMAVEVHFGFKTPVVDEKKLLIQVQVEQIHNRTIPRTDTLVFSPHYLQKMRTASQVWAIAPSHFRFLTQTLGLNNVFFVPMWHMTESDLGGELALTRKEKARLAVPTKEQQCMYAEVHPILFEGNTYTVGNCVLYPANCPETGHSSSIPLCKLPRVLFFGAVRYSHNGRRERLCQVMSEGVDDFVCYEGVFGPHLNRLIDTADVVVLDRYYAVSTIESHRIDPLLLKGKVIVSTHSFDRDLELVYNNSIVFVDRVEDMPRTVNRILNDQQMLKRMSVYNREFMRQKMMSSGPLCAALTALRRSALSSGTVKVVTERIKPDKQRHKYW